MKEFSTPAALDIDPSLSISDFLVRHATETPSKTLMCRSVGGEWQDVSASEVLQTVRGIAKGLIATGYGKGDSIAIMSRTRIEWALLDLAVWHIGAHSVPVYETSSPHQTQWILEDAACTAIITETAANAAVVEEARTEGSGHKVRNVWVIDDGAIDSLIADGADVSDDAADAGYKSTTLDDLATIIYTSGTTGRPKGAELTHGNFVRLILEALNSNLHRILEEPDTRTLLFIPMAHVFARFVSVLVIIEGCPTAYAPDPKQAVADIGTFKPTLLLSVPRIWEKIYTSAELKQGKGLKRSIFRWAVKVGVTWSRQLDEPGGPTRGVEFQHKLADKLVYSKLRELLGGRLQWTISGGAPLGDRMLHFYRGVGINMLEGYGLTETTAPTNVNQPGTIKVGTVGPPLAGTAIRILDDGEILSKGVGVFRGYHNNPEATAEAIQDGWFHTGDFGSLDADGFVRITGRKKEIIVTAGGKNVAPSSLEDPIRSHPIISQVVVVGDQQPFIAALITLDAEVLPQWLETHDLDPTMTVAEAVNNHVVRDHVQQAVDRANRNVSRAESIREIRILTDDFTLDNDMLTPSMKVKRHLVHKNYADVIAGIYAGSIPAK